MASIKAANSKAGINTKIKILMKLALVKSNPCPIDRPFGGETIASPIRRAKVKPTIMAGISKIPWGKIKVATKSQGLKPNIATWEITKLTTAALKMVSSKVKIPKEKMLTSPPKTITLRLLIKIKGVSILAEN